MTAKTDNVHKLIDEHEDRSAPGRVVEHDESQGLVAFHLSGYCRTHDGIALVSQLEDLIIEAAVISANDTSDSASGYILEEHDRGSGYWFKSGYGGVEDYGVGAFKEIEQRLGWLPYTGFFHEEWPEKTVVDAYGDLVKPGGGGDS